MDVDFEAIAKGMTVAVPFVGHVGLEVTEMSAGEATVLLPDRPELHNHVGSQHAGGLFTAAETASGAAFVGAFAARMGDVVPLAKAAEISYEKVAKGAIEARAELGIDQAEALAKLAADTFTDDGKSVKTVATATVHWHVRLKDAS